MTKLITREEAQKLFADPEHQKKLRKDNMEFKRLIREQRGREKIWE